MENFEEKVLLTPSLENITEKHPKYVFAITRHAERLASGEISPDGIESAKEKGGKFGEEAEVLKAYVSDEKSGRTFTTGDLISEESGIKSETTGEQYATRKVKDIQYGIVDKAILKRAADLINESTLEELGESTERDEEGKLRVDITKLPDQEKIAPIRAKNQAVGFRYLLGEENDEAVASMAMGLAHQLDKEFQVAGRYNEYREKKDKSLKKDAILSTVTHGMFMESLLKKAGIMIEEGGTEEPISNFEGENFGGFIDTNESIFLDIKDPNNLPERIPVRFEGNNRPAEGSVFIDREKFLALVDGYNDWKGLKESE